MAHENFTQLNTPILLIGFNRPDTIQRVFEQIARARPKQLFFFVDGPRNEIESEQVLQVKTSIQKQINWPCELKTNFPEINLGCYLGPPTAISWFFENVEKGIILEDDCIPNKSFFSYCEEVLDTYNTGADSVEDNKIMVVSGDNFQYGKKHGDASYYFSIYPNIWGWATWRKSWKLYDLKIKDFPKFKAENKIAKYFPDTASQNHWLDIFEKFYDGTRKDTWDYQWLFAVWNNGGLSVVPNKNLVSNIGFDNRATRTKNPDSKISNLKTEELEFPIRHPLIQEANKEADLHTFETLFLRKRSFAWRVGNKIRKWVRIVKKS